MNERPTRSEEVGTSRPEQQSGPEEQVDKKQPQKGATFPRVLPVKIMASPPRAEIQEFKITCRLKNEGSNSNQKIRAEVSLLGLKYAQMKSQFCQLQDNPYSKGFSDYDQYHVLVPKFNQQLEIIGTQLGFTNCHRKHVNDNRI